MGLFQSVASRIFGNESRKPDELDQAIAKTRIGTLTSEYDARFTVIEKRLSRLEKLTANDLTELRKELEAAQAEVESAQEQVEKVTNPPEAPEARAAVLLTNWGYSPEQLAAIRAWWEKTKGTLDIGAQALGIEIDPEEDPVITMKKYRGVLETMWAKDPSIGSPAKVKSAQGNTSAPVEGRIF